MTMMNDNKPTLASARLAQMIEFTLSHAQEKKKSLVWTWPRLTVGFGGLAMAASVATVMWLSPGTVPAPQQYAASIGSDSTDISDYMFYETLEDLS
jgi:hypothetical protein